MQMSKITIYTSILFLSIMCAGIYSISTLKSTASKLEDQIIRVEETAKTENWEAATNILSDTKLDWEKSEKSWAILLDHIEIDNIETSITRVEKFIETKNKSMALAEVATLKQYIKHIPEKESFNLKNIF